MIWNLTIVIIYKFCKKRNFIQPPGEPKEQHLGEVRSNKFVLQKFHKRQNYRKGRHTLTAHLWENCKKSSIKKRLLNYFKIPCSNDPKYLNKGVSKWKFNIASAFKFAPPPWPRYPLPIMVIVQASRSEQSSARRHFNKCINRLLSTNGLVGW